MAEFDASGEATRLILSRDEIIELVRVFLPDSSNEAKLIDQKRNASEQDRRTRLSASPEAQCCGQRRKRAIFEVRRILKAFVDAQWLAEFDPDWPPIRRN
jgi:hypothetical protein